jgi:isoquinoline 1-oxidoreductase alpha subunit
VDRACADCSQSFAYSVDRRTIEGLDTEGRHPLQTAWLELQVPQCSYCQPGQITQAATLLMISPIPATVTLAR